MKKYRFIKPFDDEQEWEDDVELLEINGIYNGDYIPNKWGWTIQQSFNAYPENYQEVIDKDVERQEILDAVNKPLKDNINPNHYKNGKVECIDALESATVNKTGIEAVCVANIIKYLWRYEDKNGLEDVRKSEWYLKKLINYLENDKNLNNYQVDG